jgi:hypothetical protein
VGSINGADPDPDNNGLSATPKRPYAATRFGRREKLFVVMCRGIWVAMTVSASLLVASCSATHSGAPSSSTTTTVTAKAANPDVVPEDLRATVFDRLPTDYVEEPSGSDADGPLDLAQTAEAVDDQDTAHQEAILVQYGFLSAYQRTWVVKGTSEVLIIRVQVMGSPVQALGYFNLLTSDAPTSSQLTRFALPRIADSSGFTRSFTSSTGSQVAQDVNLARGRLFYHLIFTGPQGSISPRDLLGIARSQGSQAVSLGYTT